MKLRYVIFIISVFLTIAVHSQNQLPLDSILKRSMSAAEKYNNLVECYHADVYMRTYVETQKKNFLYKYTHLVPRFVLHDPHSDEALIESISTIKFDYPNNYVQNIKNITGTLTTQRDIDMIPFNLLNINIYEETTNAESFFMPVRFSTAKYYNYKFIKEATEDDKIFYTIEFKPKYDNSKLLEGSFVIERGSWRIVHFNAEGVDSFNKFSFEIEMGNTWISRFLPTKFVIFHTASYLGNVVSNRNIADINYRDVTLRSSNLKEKNLNISDLFKIKMDSVPILNDSSFWAEHRTIPLQAREQDVLNAFSQSIRQKEVHELIYDSLDNSKKAQLFAKKMTASSRYKIQSSTIKYSGLFNPLMLGYSSTDGVIYRQKLFLDFPLKRSRTFNINAYAAYLFKRKEVITNLTTTWNYEPFHKGDISLSFGIGTPSYSSIYIKDIQNSLGQNGINIGDLNLKYYKDYYVKLYNNYELFNGFIATIGTDYHFRKPTRNNIDDIQSEVKSSSGNDEVIDNILSNKYTFAPFIRLTWTPEQYYRYEGRQKIYVRSKFPTFKIEYANSIPKVFGSSSHYDKIEVDISQNIRFGLMNSIRYHIGAGRFIRQKSEYFAEFRFFAKNYFPDNWENKTGGSFNLLDRDLFNSFESYIQAHVMFESPFLIFRSIPLLSDFISQERIYVSQLHTPQVKSYTELGYGIGNRFFRTANLGIFCSFVKHKFNEFGIKASFEL